MSTSPMYVSCNFFGYNMDFMVYKNELLMVIMNTFVKIWAFWRKPAPPVLIAMFSWSWMKSVILFFGSITILWSEDSLCDEPLYLHVLFLWNWIGFFPKLYWKCIFPSKQSGFVAKLNEVCFFDVQIGTFWGSSKVSLSLSPPLFSFLKLLFNPSNNY